MTITEARKLLGKEFESKTDEQIQGIIDFLRRLAEICYESFKNTQRVQTLYKDGYSLEDAKKQLALEGLHYDDRALQSIKEGMLKNKD